MLFHHNWMDDNFGCDGFRDIFTLRVSVLMDRLESLIDALILGDIDHIYLNMSVRNFHCEFEVNDSRSEYGIEVFNYESLEERYSNKEFLYLYVIDLAETLFYETK